MAICIIGLQQYHSKFFQIEETSLRLKTVESSVPKSNEPFTQTLKNTDNQSLQTPTPKSITGTATDGNLREDAHGNLVLDTSLLDFIHYHFNLTGETDLQTIQGRMNTIAEQTLSLEAQRQLTELIGNYLELQTAWMQVQKDFTPFDENSDLLSPEVINRFELFINRREKMRAEILGSETSQALFSEENAYDNYMLNYLKINADDSLEAEVKAQTIASQQTQLPEHFQQALANQTAFTTGLESEKELFELSSEEKYVARVERFGEEAAIRLAKLDQQRSSWQNRVSQFNQEKQQLLENPSLSKVEIDEAIQQLKQNNFSTSEQLRISSLEIINRSQQ